MMTRCETHGNLLLDPSKPFPAGESDYCHACWRAAGGVKRAGAVTVSAVAKPASRGKCAHLGRRVEFRPGCGGRMCRHECGAGEPEAVPGGVCQSCPKWEADQ